MKTEATPENQHMSSVYPLPQAAVRLGWRFRELFGKPVTHTVADDIPRLGRVILQLLSQDGHMRDE